MAWVASCGRKRPAFDFDALHDAEQRCERLLADDRLSDHQLDSIKNNLFDTFIRDFAAFNEDKGSEIWNLNDLRFMAWCMLWYATEGRRSWRRAERWKPAQLIQALVDARLRLAVAACRHEGAVTGEPFVSLEERQEEARRVAAEQVKAMDMTSQDIAMSGRSYLDVPDEDPVDQILVDWRKQSEKARRDMSRRVYTEYDQSEELRIKKLKSRVARTTSDLKALIDELSMLVVIVWRTQDSVSRCSQALKPDEDSGQTLSVLPDETLQRLRDHLSNQAEGSHHGWLFAQTVESYVKDWIPLAAHVVAHLRIESVYLDKFSHRTVRVSSGEWREPSACIFESDLDRFQEWLIDRYSREVPNSIMQDIRNNICDFYVPAGGKTFARRRTGRPIVPADVVLQLLIGSNATTEIFASVDDEIKLREVAKDRQHPMYDLTAMTAVMWACEEDMDGFSFFQDAVLPNSDLVDCSANLDKQTVFGRPRGPLICWIGDRWRVQHQQYWYSTEQSSFVACWIWWLTLLYRDHGGQTASEYNAHQWIQRLSLERLVQS